MWNHKIREYNLNEIYIMEWGGGVMRILYVRHPAVICTLKIDKRISQSQIHIIVFYCILYCNMFRLIILCSLFSVLTKTFPTLLYSQPTAFPHSARHVWGIYLIVGQALLYPGNDASVLRYQPSCHNGLHLAIFEFVAARHCFCAGNRWQSIGDELPW